ncbi:pro-sigmaK processing inhibitor BofA family protein [Sporolactobacillus sp. CPB3-1]|uniref:Pro-sigmaK processing inhibitor BofA family protein n=1 Tax=Sporolactobacillus mangiferae TaxID=2940498 RepID=A0ABT0MBK5_9BACL|nr:pro-sigmaK processing inhibitor BofA family protein [Sporolactobacillus mangiferae]MCL1632244.1 pro-sigmaK processing inhibitor BofA family protein [Sporolactobacillus mangiferae]
MNSYLYVIIGITIVFLVVMAAGASFHPLKWIGRLAVRLLVGALLLFLLNVIGESFSMHIPINLATSAASGLLGLPGIAALIIIKFSLGI